MARSSLQYHAPAIRRLALTKISSSEIAEILNLKPGTVRAICVRSNIPLLHIRGRPRVDNPVRPYRPRQKQYYQKIQTNYTGRDTVLSDPFGKGKL